MIKTSIPYKKFPETPGVYIMKDADGRILYVGKAGNLRRRVSSYFERPHDVRIQTLVSKIAIIDFEQKDTALEALIREAELIKTLTPPFNVREKDDKSFLYFEITREKFPRVLLVRGSGVANEGRGGVKSSVGGGVVQGKRFGPFTSASSAREALRILRRIFPWSTHDPLKIINPASLPSQISPNAKSGRACLDYEMGLCPGTCIGAISRADYVKNIKHLELFLEGKKKRIIALLTKEMAIASKRLDFEKAEKMRRQIFALQHIRDTALISESDTDFASMSLVSGHMFRIEGYDISDISGDSAVGSMVVFSARGERNFEPDKDEYRKFKIRTIFQPNDVGMLAEVLGRRFKRRDSGWTLPNLIVIDGGLAQANAARRALVRAGLKIPIIGIAKGPERKRNDIIGAVPQNIPKTVLIRVRDEAHRFAIGYHKALRRRKFLE